MYIGFLTRCFIGTLSSPFLYYCQKRKKGQIIFEKVRLKYIHLDLSVLTITKIFLVLVCGRR